MMSRDESLVRSALGGEARAFEKLVIRYQGAVFAVVLEIVRDTEVARDLVQDAFVQAYTRLKTLRNAGQFSFWLYRIARNLSVNWVSRRPHTMSFEEASVRDPQGFRTIASLYDDRAPDLLYEEEEMKCAVWHALDLLPEDLRGVVLLRHMEGMRIKEVAAFLGLPATTVRGRLERGRRILREQLVDLGLFEGALREERPDQRFAKRVMAALPPMPDASGPTRMFPLPVPHIVIMAVIVLSLAGFGLWRAGREADIGDGYQEKGHTFLVRRMSAEEFKGPSSPTQFAPPARAPKPIELTPVEIVREDQGISVSPPHDGKDGVLAPEIGGPISPESEILPTPRVEYGGYTAEGSDRFLRIGLVRDPSLEGIRDIQPAALRNLIRYLREHTDLDLRVTFDAVTLADPNLERYGMLYLAGSDVSAPFGAARVTRIGRYLHKGGFMFVEDLSESGEPHPAFLARIRQVLQAALGSDATFVPLSNDHPLFYVHYRFRDGPPVLHRDGTARYMERVEIAGRPCALLSRACLSLQWSGRFHPPTVDPETGEKKKAEFEPALARGLQFGVNLIRFVWEQDRGRH